jgi:hypothetical protein
MIMRITALLSMLMLALALGGCGKKDAVKKEGEAKKTAPAGEAANTKAPAADDKVVEEKAVEEAAVEEKAVEEKAVEEKAAEEKAVEEKAVEEKAVEEKAVEEKAVEEKAVEEKAAEEKTAEEKAAEEKAKAAPAPRSPEDLQARRTRIQEIYKLGRSGNADDLKQLEGIITGDGEAFEKATAIRALGNEKKDQLVDPLKTLAGGDDLAVKSEAAILLYQWGEKDFAKPLMEGMLDQGVALRRAFFKGVEDGKYIYDDDALGFFEKAMEAKQVHVRLDAALGLLHLDKKEVALAAFKEALQDAEKEYVRLTAVSYLASARDIPEAKALLEMAANDSSARVANRAKQILGTGTPQPAAK